MPDASLPAPHGQCGDPVALLIPCHNAAAYLPRLAASVRAQTRPFAEILCYDDGSTDDTVRVARELGWTILTPNPHAGPAAARNRLLAAARSPWVHFHDADDLLEPRYVESVSALLASETDVVVCNMDWVLENTRELVVAWRFKGNALVSDAVSENLRNPIGVIACTFRREALLRVGGFDESLRTWEDGDIQVRLAQVGARYRVCPEVLAIGLRHDRGASAARAGDLALEDRTRLFEQYLRTLPTRHRPAIACEAEKHAAWLMAERRRPDLAARDLAVCRAAGLRVPTTHNFVLRLARAVVPGAWLLWAQQSWRRLLQR